MLHSGRTAHSPDLRRCRVETLERRALLSADLVGDSVLFSESLAEIAFESQPSSRNIAEGELQPTVSGAKLSHPTMSNREVLTAVNLAAAAYSGSLGAATAAGLDLNGWSPVTDILVADYGLPAERLVNDVVYEQATTGESTAVFDGTAQAIVYFRPASSEAAVAFRGTAPGGSFFGLENFVGDARDWLEAGRDRHYAAFTGLFSAFDRFVRDRAISTVTVAGHSLGAAMVEQYIDFHNDGFIPGVNY